MTLSCSFKRSNVQLAICVFILLDATSITGLTESNLNEVREIKLYRNIFNCVPRYACRTNFVLELTIGSSQTAL
jgi:hypothetical protein